MAENVKVSFYVPEELDREIEDMVSRGLFTTKTDVYQEALRRLLLEYKGFRLDDELMERVDEVMD